MSQPADMTDAALVAAMQAADEGALEELYQRHSPAVFGLARKLLGEGFQAEEIVQEVFLHLWRNPGRFDPDRGALRAYLLAMTHGRSVDVLRSEGARRRREERDARMDPQHEPGVQEQVAWELGTAAEVREAMASLTSDERRAIELAYFEGRTYREVAEVLEAPEGTIKSRIRTGLQRMRGALTESGVTGP